MVIFHRYQEKKKQRDVHNWSSLKKGIIKGLATAVLATSMVVPVYAEGLSASSFKDVQRNAWYYQVVDWGVKNGVAAGYSDGTFKPNGTVTEAEFLSMVVRFFPNTKEDLKKLEAQGKTAHWSDASYGVAKLYNLAVSGHENVARRNTPITRGEVAVLLASTLGKHYDTSDAIAMLYEMGLSTGRNGKTIAGYDASGNMTRAEAVAFLKNLADKGLGVRAEKRPNELQDNPATPKYEQPTIPPVQQPPQVSGAELYAPIPKDKFNSSLNSNPPAGIIKYVERNGKYYPIFKETTTDEEAINAVAPKNFPFHYAGYADGFVQGYILTHTGFISAARSDMDGFIANNALMNQAKQIVVNDTDFGQYITLKDAQQAADIAFAMIKSAKKKPDGTIEMTSPVNANFLIHTNNMKSGEIVPMNKPIKITGSKIVFNISKKTSNGTYSACEVVFDNNHLTVNSHILVRK